ncbi:hypothetical protein EP7_004010 [Isosphaeraceae bacterium EP7]
MKLRNMAFTWMGLIGLGLAVGLMSPSESLAADDPPKFVGTWTWKWKDGEGETHRHVLEVEGEPSKLAARERFDDSQPVKAESLKVDGKKVTFIVVRGERRAEYSGKFDGPDTINGKVTVQVNGQPEEFGWTATRETTKP